MEESNGYDASHLGLAQLYVPRMGDCSNAETLTTKGDDRQDPVIPVSVGGRINLV